MPHRGAAAILLLFLGCEAAAFASEMPVPVHLQVALFKKIFDYDRTLANRGEVQVMVVHTGTVSQLSQDVVKAFREAGIVSSAIGTGELAGKVADVAVVYVTPGVETAPIAELCARHGILSVSGVPELAMKGDVAIGIGTSDQKPQILVHLRRVKTEGHELASALLEVATVIR